MQTAEVSARYDVQTAPADYGNQGLKYGIIEVTSNCQAKCPGCYMVAGDKLNKGSPMTLDTAVRALDLCRDFRGGQELETMDILGGEPLLWPNLQKYVAILLQRGIKPWIFTNMLGITPSKAAWLREREVNITGKLNIDPTDPSQYALQGDMLGMPGTEAAERLIRAIQIFLKAGYKDPLFRLQNLIRKGNLAFVKDYYRYCLENEIGTDLELMGSGEAADERYAAIAPSPDELATMIQGIQELRISRGLEPRTVLMPHVFGACPFYDKGMYFAADGTIRACSNSAGPLARLDDPDPIRTAWDSSLIQDRLRLTRDTVGEPCKSCEKWDQCRGGCRATVEGMGDANGGYTLCPVPALNRMGLTY